LSLPQGQIPTVAGSIGSFRGSQSPACASSSPAPSSSNPFSAAVNANANSQTENNLPNKNSPAVLGRAIGIQTHSNQSSSGCRRPAASGNRDQPQYAKQTNASPCG